MAARDGASSVQGVKLRATRLNTDGSINTAYPVFTTNGFISASFTSEFEDGDEITEKAADGSVCIAWKADDTLKRLTFALSLCSPDPEAAALIAGGEPICDSGAVVGYTSQPVGSVAGNPVAIEIWSYANIGGKPASGTPYFHWVFPFVKVRYDGTREFTNGALANEFTGQALGNDALVSTGLNPSNPTDDYVKYKCALTNPFSYVRSTSIPANGWSMGAWPSSLCLDCAATLATGATAGTPGTWTPPGSAAPANLAALTGASPAIVASPTTAWTTGQRVVLGDSSLAHWDGTAWVSGSA